MVRETNWNPVRTYVTHAKAEPEIAKNVRELKNLGATLKEVQTYLNMYYSVENRRFGVVKVGGGVVLDNLDDLVESISTLVKFGLIPVVVHGAGPQMNEALKKLGIPSSYDEGLRITTPEILKVARKVFVETNFRIANALERNGIRATPIQTGVFEAKPRDMSRWGYVGDVTHVNVEPIFSAIDNGCVPILTCMGQSEDGHFLNINADIAARDVARVTQPRTIVYVSQKGGLLGKDGKILQSIDINYDYENLISQPWFQHGDALKLKEIRELMQHLPSHSTVSVTSAKLMARELLTHSLSGTLVTNTERINIVDSTSKIDKDRMKLLLEHSFAGKLTDNFFENVEQNLDAIYISELYHSLAIICKLQGVPYLNKFAVSQEMQMAGLGGRLWDQLVADYKSLIWRSRTNNPVNRWYFERAQGSYTDREKGWTVFWYGLKDFKQVEELVKEVLALPKDILKSNDYPKPVTEAVVKEKPDVPKVEEIVFNVGLIGARGHTGLELVKLIEAHPYLQLTVASSRAMVGKPLSTLYPETENDILFCDLEPEAVKNHDVHTWILAMPNGASKQYIDHIPSSAKVVDLSADNRFDSTWQYGLPEMGDNRQKIRHASRIANPGCYATGQQLAILPLLGTQQMPRILTGTPVVFGVSGYSGAGTTPSPKNDVTRLRDNMMAYSLQGHLHEQEVSHHLATLGHPYGVRFTPHVAQWFRGIHLTMVMDLFGTEDREGLLYRYRSFYQDEPLVEVVDSIPEVKDIAGKHNVVLGGFSLNEDKTRLVIVATIDNLLKGAATQCMQNINLMMGFDEFTSILPKEETIDVVGVGTN